MLSSGSWGVGIRHFCQYNQLLLGKCLWRYADEKDHLWRKVIDCRFGMMQSRKLEGPMVWGFGRPYEKDGEISQNMQAKKW